MSKVSQQGRGGSGAGCFPMGLLVHLSQCSEVTMEEDEVLRQEVRGYWPQRHLYRVAMKALPKTVPSSLAVNYHLPGLL